MFDRQFLFVILLHPLVPLVIKITLVISQNYFNMHSLFLFTSITVYICNTTSANELISY